jgi:hypothetical protein
MTVNPTDCFCSDPTLFGHGAVQPLLDYHGRVVSTFDRLEDDCPVFEVIKRVLLVIAAPIAYLILSFSALVGVGMKSISACFKQNINENPPDETTLNTENDPSHSIPDFSQWRENFSSEVKQRVGLEQSKADSELLSRLQPRAVDVKFSQYTFPEVNPQALGNSFRCVEAVKWMNSHFKEILERWVANDQQFFVDMQRIILKEGKEARLSIFEDFMQDPPLHEEIPPHEIPQYTNRYESLKLDDDTDTAATRDDESLLPCLKKLFNPPNHDVRRFALVSVDEKTTYAFLRIDNTHAFLFDPHSTQFQIVTKELTQAYLEKDVTSDNENQVVNFCFGSIEKLLT